MELKIYHEVPKDFYNIELKDLHQLLGGPSLFHLKGEGKNPLFVSTLLHGNETTGFLAVKQLLKEYRGKSLPRDLIIFFGNTEAASQGMRHFEGQLDFNRIWNGGNSPEALLAAKVKAYAKEHNLFASIDVHNNTGKNPFYGCVNVFKKEYVELASYFSQKIVYFTEPSSVQSMAFSKICPAVTIEAGLPGNPEGTEEVLNFIQTVLQLKEFDPNFDSSTVDVFHTIARIHIQKDAKIDFTDSLTSKADLSLIEDIETKNFIFVPKGSHLGFCKNMSKINVLDNEGKDITSDFLQDQDGELVTGRLFVPSMFTRDTYVIKEDCLGYVMETLAPTKL